jgi:hypothetical protein
LNCRSAMGRSHTPNRVERPHQVLKKGLMADSLTALAAGP